MTTQKPKILYVQKPSIGGTVTGLIDLIQGLDKDRYEPMVMFYKPSPYREQIEKLGVRVIILNRDVEEKNRDSRQVKNKRITQKLQYYNRGLSRLYIDIKKLYQFIKNDLKLACKFKKIVQQENIDIIHHNNNLPSDRAFVAGGVMARKRQVCHIRTLAELSLVEKIFARFVHQFIYMSHAIEDVYLRNGIGAGRGCVIYDGFCPKAYDDANDSQKATFYKEYQLKASNIIVCNVGRIERWKGHDVFIKAMRLVIDRYPSAIGLIVGPTNGSQERQAFYSELKTLAQRLKIDKKIIFTGFRSDVAFIMKSSNIIVHSASKPEPFGRVIVEGMLAAKPVIATAAGGVLDIIDDRQNGYLVPVNDDDAMAAAILSVLHKGADAAEAFGQNAREHALRKFSVDQNIENIQRIYARLESI